MVKIYTAQMATPAMDSIDITVRSADDEGRCLAPTWELVGGLKAGQGHEKFKEYRPITETEYTSTYLDLLRQRWRSNPTPFKQLAYRQRITLKCYCATGAFCHRHLAAGVLVKIATSLGLPGELSGELTLPKQQRRMFINDDTEHIGGNPYQWT